VSAPDWSEWGRYTLSAVAGAIVSVVATTVWLTDVKNTAANAATINTRQDAQMERLGEIASDTKGTLIRITALMEATIPQHAAAIKSLEDRVRAVEGRR
jgi:enamine deaminase RidA (YjgF/YER057c/UK114 family)